MVDACQKRLVERQHQWLCRCLNCNQGDALDSGGTFVSWWTLEKHHQETVILQQELHGGGTALSPALVVALSAFSQRERDLEQILHAGYEENRFFGVRQCTVFRPSSPPRDNSRHSILSQPLSHSPPLDSVSSLSHPPLDPIGHQSPPTPNLTSQKEEEQEQEQEQEEQEEEEEEEEEEDRGSSARDLEGVTYLGTDSSGNTIDPLVELVQRSQPHNDDDNEDEEEEEGIHPVRDNTAGNTSEPTSRRNSQQSDSPLADPLPSSQAVQPLVSLASRTTYRPPPSLPQSPPSPKRELTDEEQLSLKLRCTNLKNGSTQAAYEDNAQIWRDEGKRDVMSLYRVDQLLEELSGVEVKLVDICPRGCMAYTGPVHSRKDYCDQWRRVPLINDRGEVMKTAGGKVRKVSQQCRLSRYKDKKKKEAVCSIKYFGVVSRMRELFRDPEIAKGLGSLGERLKKATEEREKEGGDGHPTAYDDFGDGDHLYTLSKRYPELFEDPRTTFFNVSTDGAILKLGRDGDFWSIEATISNLPIEMGRYRRQFQWTSALLPTKLPPIDLESFFYPLIEELDDAAMGFHFWDAHRKEWFLWKGAWSLLLADQMGMAKLNGMNGSRGHVPCWFCKIVRCHANEGKQGSYCPLRTVRKDLGSGQVLNGERPGIYDGYNLPMRDAGSYERTKAELASTLDSKEIARISRDSGINKISLFQQQPLYLHPSSTPSDISHLLFEDTGKTYYLDVFIKQKHLSETGQAEIGQLYRGVELGLPSSICSAKPRSIVDYFNTAFKMWEMVIWIVWFSVPMLSHAGMDSAALEVWAKYVLLVEKVLDRSPLTPSRVEEIRNLAVEHQHDFEKVFVKGNLSDVSLVTLSFHFLLHLSDNIRWHGNPQLYSQFPMERKLGWLKRLVRQWSSEYRTLECEYSRHVHRDFVLFRHPELAVGTPCPSTLVQMREVYRLKGEIPIGGRSPIRNDQYWSQEEALLEEWFEKNSSTFAGTFSLGARERTHFFRSLSLPGGNFLGTLRTHKSGKRERYHFLGQEPGQPRFYGQVVSFLRLTVPTRFLTSPPSGTASPSSDSHPNVIYKLALVYRFGPPSHHFDQTRRNTTLFKSSLAPYVQEGSSTLELIPVEHICELVGVLRVPKVRRIYILRSTPLISSYISSEDEETE